MNISSQGSLSQGFSDTENNLYSVKENLESLCSYYILISVVVYLDTQPVFTHLPDTVWMPIKHQNTGPDLCIIILPS